VKRTEYVGTVISIEGDKAVVQLRAHRSCASVFGCACCSNMRPEATTVRVERGDLEEGDTVQVSVPAYAGYVSTFPLFVLPMILTIAGLPVGGWLEGGGSAHGMPTIIGGVLGFLLAVLIAVVVNRALSDARNYEVQRLRGDETVLTGK